ncbi:MAG: exopolysaccharide biosynthesis protein [Caulobacterales bacterium]|nr:exopolysaccharide biosynthesis protein [Caulobacterales bacterium]
MERMSPQPLSAILTDIVETDRDHLTLADLTARFGGRAIGALLFVLGLACTLPLPPGATTIFGLPLLALAAQLALGATQPWLPERVKAREIPAAKLRSGLARAIPWLRRVEAVSRPRLAGMFSPLGQRLIGGVCTLLAVVLILPIPLGNMLPALAVSTLSFSLIQRDGLIAILGHAAAVASAGVLALAGHIIVRALQQAWALVAAA